MQFVVLMAYKNSFLAKTLNLVANKVPNNRKNKVLANISDLTEALF